MCEALSRSPGWSCGQVRYPSQARDASEPVTVQQSRGSSDWLLLWAHPDVLQSPPDLREMHLALDSCAIRAKSQGRQGMFLRPGPRAACRFLP